MTNHESNKDNAIHAVSDRLRHYTRCENECRNGCRMKDILSALGGLAAIQNSTPQLEKVGDALDDALADSCRDYRLASVAID